MILSLYGSRRQFGRTDSFNRFFTELNALGVSYTIEERFHSHLLSIGTTAMKPAAITGSSKAPVTDLAVCFGGDGTMLRTVRIFAGSETTVYGVNTGHLGFLAASKFDNPEESVRNIVNRNFGISKRTMLYAEFLENGEQRCVTALNEIALSKRDSSSMINICCNINNNPLATYRADGLIVATPTGSTAYNLAVGGPIITPECNVLAISPISAHSLTMRPLVIPDSSEISLHVTSRHPTFLLSNDGVSHEVAENSTISVGKTPFHASIATNNNETFTDTLRRKMLWDS